MTQACTLISPTDQFDLKRTLGLFVKNSGKIKQTSPKVATVLVGQLRLRFTVMERKRPGDKYSHLILGFGSHFGDVRTKARTNKKHVLQSILNAQSLIGVVANPTFDEKADAVVLGLAESLDALVCTGDAMLNGKGELVLNKPGKFDVELPAADS